MPDPIVVTLPVAAERCFTLFCDARLLKMWVPGLRRVVVVRSHPDGLPLEVKCEFAESRSYSLLYEYDKAARRVEWTPGLGSRDAVRGNAVFDEGGAHECRLTYELSPGAGRTEKEVELGSPHRVVEAFVQFVKTLPEATP
jgi:hypothetical protein